MIIRAAVPADLPALAAMEAACFPPEEAASQQVLAGRLAVYPQHFWLLEEGGLPTSFINGPAANEPRICDEMYADASFHDEKGAWQMIFGVNTLPPYRKQGRAALLMERVIAGPGGRGGEAVF